MVDSFELSCFLGKVKLNRMFGLTNNYAAEDTIATRMFETNKWDPVILLLFSTPRASFPDSPGTL